MAVTSTQLCGLNPSLAILLSWIKVCEPPAVFSAASIGKRWSEAAEQTMTRPPKLKALAASHRMLMGCVLLALTVTGAQAQAQQIVASPIGGKVEVGGCPIAKS